MKIAAYLASIFLFMSSLSLAQSMTKKDSISYGMGLIMAEELKKSGIKDLDTKMMLKAMEDYMAGTTKLNVSDLKPIINAYKIETQKKSGNDFLSQNKKRSGVIVTPSGLQYEIIHASGNQQKPSLTSKVTTHYHGTLPSGPVFDSSVNRGQPSSFALNQVIKGWQEGLQLMNVGDKYKFYIPQELGYGARGSSSGSIPPYSALVFEVELISIDDVK